MLDYSKPFYGNVFGRNQHISIGISYPVDTNSVRNEFFKLIKVQHYQQGGFHFYFEAKSDGTCLFSISKVVDENTLSSEVSDFHVTDPVYHVNHLIDKQIDSIYEMYNRVK